MGRQSILIIEDERAIADTIIYALSTEGLDTTWKATAEEGLTEFSRSSFNLVLIDIGLPDIHGFEVLKEIRKSSTVPIIFLTARTEEIDKVLGLELGADDYITKPFSPRELAARIKANIRRHCLQPVETATTVENNQVGNEERLFSIDDERKQITCGGSPVDLSASEFRVLRILIENPGRVYSRDIILQLAWDDTSSVYDRTVDAHIKSIRAKLRKAGCTVDPIVTHRGFGYSLQEPS
jgi:two-component system catabolic regulation response regulator CreB